MERVPDELLLDLQDLPTLLETKCGNFETFHMNPQGVWELVLDNVLGENDRLVKEILQCMDEVRYLT